LINQLNALTVDLKMNTINEISKLASKQEPESSGTFCGAGNWHKPEVFVLY
jgi:hypothetical protein